LRNAALGTALPAAPTAGPPLPSRYRQAIPLLPIVAVPLLLGLLFYARSRGVEADRTRCSECSWRPLCEKTPILRVLPPLRYEGLELRSYDYWWR